MNIMERFKHCRHHELCISGLATCASNTVLRVHLSAIFYHEIYMKRLISAYSVLRTKCTKWMQMSVRPHPRTTERIYTK